MPHFYFSADITGLQWSERLGRSSNFVIHVISNEAPPQTDEWYG